MDTEGPIFIRQLINDGLDIESTCNLCGTVIIGRAMHGLLEQEQQHIETCPKRQSG